MPYFKIQVDRIRWDTADIDVEADTLEEAIEYVKQDTKGRRGDKDFDWEYVDSDVESIKDVTAESTLRKSA